MEQIVKSIKEIFNNNDLHVEVVKRLEGGMSNTTYVVKVNDDFYTYRIPGKYAYLYVDRTDEVSGYSTIEDINVSTPLVYINEKTGIKVSKYVEGKILNTINPLEHLKEVKNILVKLHSLKGKNDYNPFNRFEKYEEYVKNYEKPDFDLYLKLKGELIKHKEMLENAKKVFCHNDAMPSNFILADKLYLVDFEFAGNNDYIYDIACFGNENFICGKELMKEYLPNASKEEWQRFYLWKIFQNLQWYNVALHKDMLGTSIELNLDFKAIGISFLKKALDFYQELIRDYNFI